MLLHSSSLFPLVPHCYSQKIVRQPNDSSHPPATSSLSLTSYYWPPISHHPLPRHHLLSSRADPVGISDSLWGGPEYEDLVLPPHGCLPLNIRDPNFGGEFHPPPTACRADPALIGQLVGPANRPSTPLHSSHRRPAHATSCLPGHKFVQGSRGPARLINDTRPTP